MVKLLVQSGASITVPSKRGDSPLSNAAHAESTAILGIHFPNFL